MVSSAKRRTSSTIRRVPTGEGSSGPLTEGLTSTDRQLGFQKQLSSGVHPPIVFITGHGDIPSSVRTIQGGAVDFLTKPVGENALVAAVQAAIDRDRVQRSVRAELDELDRRLASLTPRERDGLPLVVSGFLNKQAAAELGISQVTVEIHRSKIMRKMQAASLADLVRIAEKLQIPVIHSRLSAARKNDGPEVRGGDRRS